MSNAMDRYEAVVVLQQAQSLMRFCSNRSSCVGCPFHRHVKYGGCAIKNPDQWAADAIEDAERNANVWYGNDTNE